MSQSIRRRRRRSLPVPLSVGLILAVFLFILIGGVTRISSSSGSYRASVDRSFGALATVVAKQSNLEGSQVRQLVSDLSGTALTRVQLRQLLDSLVGSTAVTSTQAATVSSPAPVNGIQIEFERAMSDRATAVSQLRSAVVGLLGLPPLPGSSSGVGLAEQTTPPSVLISSGKATQEIAAAGSLMLSSDRAYAEARRQLRAAPGGARMPGSTWVPDPVEWGPGFVATMVDELSSSPGLLPNTDVKLVAVRLDPSVVPPSGGSGSGIQVVSPTKSLGVTMVVQNTGNVIAAHVTATATLQPASGGPSKTVKTVVSLFPGGTAALPLRRLQVSPGATYQLNLSITPPPSQVDQSALTLQPMTIQVAGSSVIDMKLASLSVRPSPEPRRTGTLAGSLLVPTTTSLQATAEILNAGNVAVHGVPVTASLEEVDVQVAPQTQSKLVSVQAGAQLNAAFPSFLVQPGATYVLSVSIALPPGQIDETALSLQETISVSPTTRHGPAAP